MSGLDIGLVYDLRSEYLALGYAPEAVAEFDSEQTIDLISAALQRGAHRVTRVGNGRALARALADGERYDLVFSIAEGLGGRAREAQVPALCELYQQPYVFSDPLTLSAALDKGTAKRLVRDAGVVTAPFVVSGADGVIPPFDFDYPVFAKPLAEGTGKGCEINSRCTTPAELARTVADLQQRFAQPVIIEPYLGGREFTVGIVDGAHGPEIAGILEIVLRESADSGIYTFRNKEECEQHVDYRAADDAVAGSAGALALAAYAALECRDTARIDIRCTADGQPYFLEANPLPGLHPQHSDLPMAAVAGGHSYDWLMQRIVANAARRYALYAHTTPAQRVRRPLVAVMHAANATRADEVDTLECAQHVHDALERLGYTSEIVRFTPAPHALAELARRRPQVVFNLVEAIDGRAAGSVLAPWSFAQAGLPFTGNDYAACLATASKLVSKGLLQAHRINTPALVEAGDPYRGPVILKPEWEHGSLGIDSSSVIAATSMQRALSERAAQFGERFFAETFVAGREFNVALLDTASGVRVLPIQETLFVDWPEERARIVDFDAKWSAGSSSYRNTPRRFEVETREPQLAQALTAAALRVWQAFGLAGYARIDMRVDAAGAVWVIDVNANPGLGADAGYVAAAAQGGLDFDALVGTLVSRAAAQRAAA